MDSVEWHYLKAKLAVFEVVAVVILKFGGEIGYKPSRDVHVFNVWKYDCSTLLLKWLDCII